MSLHPVDQIVGLNATARFETTWLAPINHTELSYCPTGKSFVHLGTDQTAYPISGGFLNDNTNAFDGVDRQIDGSVRFEPTYTWTTYDGGWWRIDTPQKYKDQWALTLMDTISNIEYVEVSGEVTYLPYKDVGYNTWYLPYSQSRWGHTGITVEFDDDAPNSRITCCIFVAGDFGVPPGMSNDTVYLAVLDEYTSTVYSSKVIGTRSTTEKVYPFTASYKILSATVVEFHIESGNDSITYIHTLPPEVSGLVEANVDMGFTQSFPTNRWVLNSLYLITNDGTARTNCGSVDTATTYQWLEYDGTEVASGFVPYVDIPYDVGNHGKEYACVISKEYKTKRANLYYNSLKIAQPLYTEVNMGSTFATLTSSTVGTSDGGKIDLMVWNGLASNVQEEQDIHITDPDVVKLNGNELIDDSWMYTIFDRTFKYRTQIEYGISVDYRYGYEPLRVNLEASANYIEVEIVEEFD